MKNLFKLKKIFMLSAAVMLPIGGIAIAVPLLIQQYPTSSVQKVDNSIQSKVLSSNQFATTKKVKEEKTVQEFNKITEDSEGNKKVTWKDATIPMVSKELTRVFPPIVYEKPSKVEVNVSIIPKPIVENSKKVVKHNPKTLVEKIFAYITGDGEKTKEGVENIRKQHFKELEEAKKVEKF